MVVDDANVYWTNFDSGQVLRCAIDGCNNTPTVMADVGSNQPCRMTMDDTHIYWVTCPPSGTGAVYAQPK
jgi:hypothetical protein